MEIADKITLFTGFGGVVLGAFIAILGEWRFRKAELKANSRRKFIACIVELARTISDQHSLLKSITSILPDEQPALISGNVRAFASIHIPLSELDVETLLFSGDKKDEIFTDLSLYLRRFNSNLNTLEVVNDLHVSVTAERISSGGVTPTGDRDHASVEINSTDTRAVMQLLKLENLYRDTIKNLIIDFSEGKVLLQRMNDISKRRYKKFPWQKAPSVEILEEFTPKEYLLTLPYFEMSQLVLE